jgi:putative peptidoglycan lipid II flippase
LALPERASSSRDLARSAGLISLATFASRILGLVRDQVQAALFATSPANDAFVLATRIPTLLRDLFAEGAMSAAFVPTFTRTLTTDGKAAAWRLGSQVINALLLVTGILVVLGMVFAAPIATFYGGDFAATPGKLELTIQLTRINMPFLLLVAVAAAYMGMLNALRRFFVPAMAPAMYNVIFIVSALALTPVLSRMGVPPIFSLTVGMLGGGVAQIVTQWPVARREGYRHAWVLNPKDPRLREVLVLMGPGTLGGAAAQINVFVNTILATGEPGAVSALGYAFRFMYLPVGIFAVSVATAAIPQLARHAATQAFDEMRRTISWSLRMMLMLSVPATVGLMVLSTPIVALIYEHGEFKVQSEVMVAASLFFYAVGIVGYSVVKIAIPSFYSLRDARTPVIASVVTITGNILLNIWLHGMMGFRGLALGTGIAATVNAGILLFLLARRLGGLEGGRVLTSLAKITVASAVMGFAAYFAEAWLHDRFPARALWPHAIRVFGGISGGLATLALSAWLLRIEEFSQVIQRVLARVRLGRPPGVDS